MSMHKIKPSEHEEEGLRLYGLPVGSPSQLSDCFRNGFAWADHCAQVEVEKLEEELETLRAENAKLIAERDMLKLCADHNEDEVKKMMAERDEYLANKILDASDKKLLDRLLAEREAMHKKLEAQDDHCKTLSGHIDDLNAELHEAAFAASALWAKIGEYQAEREVMMKQEPLGFIASQQKEYEAESSRVIVDNPDYEDF